MIGYDVRNMYSSFIFRFVSNFSLLNLYDSFITPLSRFIMFPLVTVYFRILPHPVLRLFI